MIPDPIDTAALRRAGQDRFGAKLRDLLGRR
jgi:hypothetical protein